MVELSTTVGSRVDAIENVADGVTTIDDRTIIGGTTDVTDVTGDGVTKRAPS